MKHYRKFSLKKIFVSNYKNITNINLDVKKFLLLVGSNNSGKSNFFEIFDILENIYFGGDIGRKYAVDVMFFNEEPTLIKIEYDIINDKDIIKSVYEIQIKIIKEENDYKLIIEKELFSFKSKSSTGKPKNLFVRKNNKVKLRGKIKEQPIKNDLTVYDILKSKYPEEEDFPDEYHAFFPLLSFISPSIISTHRINHNYSEEIQPLVEKLFKLQQQEDDDFLQFKNTLVDILDLNDIQFYELSTPLETSKEKVYLCLVSEMHNKQDQPFPYMSDGTKILFLMLYNIFIDKKPFVLIEEPEIGLHPKALSKLFQLFFDQIVSSQAIITTHSPYLLNLVNPQNVYILEKEKEGKYSSTNVSTVNNLKNRLKSKYVNFGDLFVENFETQIDTSLD